MAQNLAQSAFGIIITVVQARKDHERTTTAKNMGILKYHQTSLIS
jgi:hypothetical protein